MLDVTKPSYNKVVFLVPTIYVFFTLIWETWYNKVIFVCPKVLVLTRLHCINFLLTLILGETEEFHLDFC